MSELLLYLGVFLTAATPVLEVWIAASGGVAAGLPPLPVAFVGFLGNAATLLPVVLAGDRVRSWLRRWRRRRQEESAAEPEVAKAGRKQKIFDRFGVPGLAFLGPFTVGSHAAAAFAITAGASRRQILVWFMAALALCSLFFAILADLGLELFS